MNDPLPEYRPKVALVHRINAVPIEDHKSLRLIAGDIIRNCCAVQPVVGCAVTVQAERVVRRPPGRRLTANSTPTARELPDALEQLVVQGRHDGAERIHRVRVVLRPRPTAKRQAYRHSSHRVRAQEAFVDVELHGGDDPR